MGIEVNLLRFLLYARTRGASFHESGMIGRQALMFTAGQLRRSFNAFGEKLLPQDAQDILSRNGGFAEPLFQRLGATTIESFDNSPYENASQIFDLNQPLPENLKNRYSVVVDGGSLEHVFDVKTALKNCMELVKPGGHYISATPANNLFGHGFYQFSPELIFRVFSRENGFEIVSMLAFEDRFFPTWYSIRDPNAVNSRVTLINRRPVYLLVLAKRFAEVPIFSTTPQQSDYSKIWQSSQSGTEPDAAKRRYASLKKRIPASVRQLLINIQQRMVFGFDSRFFTRFDPKRP